MKKFLNLKFIISLIIILIFPLNSNSDTNRPILGIEYAPITQEFIKRYNLNLNEFEGVYITAVTIKSAADLAGIMPDDILITFDNKEIRTGLDLGKYLNLTKPGNVVPVEIIRNGKYLSKYVTLLNVPSIDSPEKFAFKRSKKIIDNYTLENAIFTHADIKNLYPKYFPAKLINKYQNKVIVVCVVKNDSNKIFKLNDEILSIDGEPPPKTLLFTNQPVTVKFKRNNKIFKKKITPVEINLSNLRHDCIPEYKDFDCVVDYFSALEQTRKSKNALIAWKKAYRCIADYYTIPFSNIISKENSNLKIDVIANYLAFLQYDAPTKDLNEIKKILEIAKFELNEFEQFKKLYPSHKMEKSYLSLVDNISRATSWAVGSFNENLKSTQNDVLKTDQKTVKIVKKNLENLIEIKGLNNVETVKFLTRNSKFLRKGKEIKYLIKKYEQFKYEIDWKNDEFSPYFDNIYANLTLYYTINNDYQKLSKHIDESLKIAEDNYTRLHFKNAYSEFLMNKVHFLLSSAKADSQIYDKYRNLFKKAEKHSKNLESLSVAEKKQMIKIDKDYYLDLQLVLYLDFIIENSLNSKSGTIYPLKMLKFIESNRDYSFYKSHSAALSILLQSSIIEDDLTNFNFANNELSILISKSLNDKKLLDTIRPTAGLILQSYFHNGFNEKFNEFLDFYEKTYVIKDSNKSDLISSIDYFYFKGIGYLNQNKYDKAQKVFESRLDHAKIGLATDTTKFNTYDVVVNVRFVPELYKIYAETDNIADLNSLNYKFLSKDLDELNKRDLEIISRSLSYSKFKIFNSYLKYFSKLKNQKKIKLIKDYLFKNLDSDLKKIYDSKMTLNEGMTEFTILKELTDIALILINNSNEKDGLKILNKLNPYIIKYYEKKSKAIIWRPNLEDNFFSFVYLNAAEKLKNDKLFFKKAYDIAQISKNTFTSRDLKKTILKKKFIDKDGLIEKYEKFERELAVNLRSSQFKPGDSRNNSAYSERLNKKNRVLQNEISKLRKEIEKKFPEYFKLTIVQTAKIDEIQKKIKKNEIILDYYFFNNKVFVVSISKDGSKIYSNDINLNELNKNVSIIRDTLIPEDEKIKLYAVNDSYILNKKTFLFMVDAIQDYKDIVIIPDGPLNSLPLHALAYEKSQNCFDCRNINFNLKKYSFSYSPSLESLINIDTISNDFKKLKIKFSNELISESTKNVIDVLKQDTGVKSLQKIKELVKRKNKSEKIKVSQNSGKNTFYLGIGDPDLYSDLQVKNIDSKNKVTMLRSLFENTNINSNSIKEIYGPVEGSAEEIREVAKYLSPLKSKILLREQAKESNLKELDLRNYKIIHLATHGEISGAITGIDEPFLVLSPPGNSSIEDGLLKMSEIMSLDTNANLVVLSACNTGAGDEVGSSGFSGLAKSFFMSGSKSVLVSNWYVETYSAKEIVISLFKNLKENPTFTISEGLNKTMLSMAKNQKGRSHPMFWAPFIVVGKNQPLLF